MTVQDSLDVTRALGDFAAGLTLSDIPEDVASRAKTLILDTMGIAVRAQHEAPSTPSLIAAARALGYANGSARVIGSRDGWTPPGAAWLNGALAHSLDFDDTHAGGSIHPSAPIVPAAFAAAEMSGCDGATVLAAIIAGYEVQIRLSLALNPIDHYNRGYHPTATCGVFGAAAAAGRCLGLSGERIAASFGIALSQSAGSLEFLAEGSWSKLFQVGWAAQSGVVAARLAAEDFKAPAHGIDGKRGFLALYAPNATPAKAAAGLGSVWETLNVAVKPYPSCRYSHAPMDAVMALRAANDIKAEEVTTIRIGLPANGMTIIGGPIEMKRKPVTVVDGQFSMPFLAAAALRLGGFGWDDYKTHLTDKTTLDLTNKVSCELDARCDAAFPANMAGSATIETTRGSFETFVEVPKGEPDNWPSEDEHRAKFDALVGPCLPPERAAALAEAILSLDRQTAIAGVLDLSRPAPQPLRAAGEE
ncbi:MmgE/PrpD family protein [Thalassobaculum litoreum]|uniref:2-methylcitrate dehydratase PrpD n=1 Tax=Thalassobaculum litoreum DSM 18839 TaxID=1123362 RepID=A0A8G2BKI8_9PROT|nr:MmgE/PrpD family protein [Thalassobaculum litoreum]SDG23255.1 2-methylcitrate dehydratase PrpD [Thalassobaculum litoreum DSM 18839]